MTLHFIDYFVENLLTLSTGKRSTIDGNKTGQVGHDSPHDEFRLLQPIWDMRLGYEDHVASPLFPIFLSLLFYVLNVLPFMFLDTVGRNWRWIQKYKFQPDREVTWTQIRRAVVLTAWNHVLFILPVSAAQWVWTPPTPLPRLAPGVWEFVWVQYAALVVFDAEYALWHVIHHKVRFLYKQVHSVHHQYSSPSSWVTEYLHPYELISIGFFTTTSPWIFGAHAMTQFSFMLTAIFISVDVHCGYDLPLMPHRWMPFWGGSPHHDMHHQRPLTNFQPFFNWWDRLFGSHCPGLRAGGVKPPELVAWERAPRKLVKVDFGEADSARVKPRIM